VTLLSVYLLSQVPGLDGAFKLIGPFSATLLVPFFVHATQFATNVRFWDLSDRWDELAGWQRGVLGIAIVLLAGGLIALLGFGVALHLGASPVATNGPS
jgi:hypothetical protein